MKSKTGSVDYISLYRRVDPEAALEVCYKVVATINLLVKREDIEDWVGRVSDRATLTQRWRGNPGSTGDGKVNI